MSISKKYIRFFIILSILLVLFFLINLSLGSVSIPIDEIVSILTTQTSSKSSWNTIIINYRLPKAITALLVGAGLSISGLLMQTLFRNPLAGPFVLGISSGASLGVALLILGSGIFGGIFFELMHKSWSLAFAASLGAFLVLLVIIITANKVKNTMSVLIIGLMFSALTSAIINILTYFSEATQIQQYQFWGFGSLGNLSWQEVSLLSLVCFICFLITFTVIKPLNSFLLGEQYAKSMGINIQKSRTTILLITSILTGIITAFSGPIAFIGLAIPHLAKITFTTSNHKILLPACAFIGAIVLLICDTLSRLPFYSFVIPINAITSLFGAPLVIWLLIRKKKIYV